MSNTFGPLAAFEHKEEKMYELLGLQVVEIWHKEVIQDIVQNKQNILELLTSLSSTNLILVFNNLESEPHYQVSSHASCLKYSR